MCDVGRGAQERTKSGDVHGLGTLSLDLAHRVGVCRVDERKEHFRCVQRPGVACKKELILRVTRAELWRWGLATKQHLIRQNQPRSSQGGEPLT